MKILLASPYEIGRQPFALAHPAALLRAAGHEVALTDLTLDTLPWATLAAFDVIGVSLGMHTATRIAVRLLPRIRACAPGVRLVCYGLYAPPNAPMLRDLGVSAVLGAEFEEDLLALLADDGAPSATSDHRRVRFVRPDRHGLPPLARYAHLIEADGTRRTVGFVESTRGCKYLCRHCPVVPVYAGQFRAIPRDLVLADAAQQIAAGATHLSFGDPDFFNGPTHALRIAAALHEQWPTVTFDATIKVSHLRTHATLLADLAACGCRIITTAVESFDDTILGYLDKGHTAADVGIAVASTRDAGISLAPTFVPFTPWTTLEGYRLLLTQVCDLGLINSVAPIQLAIRLLVPRGSYLLRLPGFLARLEPFSEDLLGYPWRTADPAVDALQMRVQAVVEAADHHKEDRLTTFRTIWALAHAACGRPPPPIPETLAGPRAPRLSEPWYCCAEPTAAQLAMSGSP
ncbi:MAG: CUAEP/CCAEP-tail radical SAM (seleno)protein [Acidiferrobacter sp.]